MDPFVANPFLDTITQAKPTNSRRRNLTIFLLILVLSSVFIYFWFLIRFFWIPIPQGTFFLAAIPPFTDIPSSAPPAWHAIRNSGKPFFIGLAIPDVSTSQTTPITFTLTPTLHSADASSTTQIRGWQSSIPIQDILPITSIVKHPIQALFSDAWFWFKEPTISDEHDSEMQGPVNQGIWKTTAQTSSPTIDLNAFYYFAEQPIPENLAAIGLPTSTSWNAVGWSLDEHRAFSSLFLNADLPISPTDIASASAFFKQQRESVTTTANIHLTTTTHSMTFTSPDLPIVPSLGSCPGKPIARLPVQLLDGWIPWRPDGTALILSADNNTLTLCWIP